MTEGYLEVQPVQTSERVAQVWQVIANAARSGALFDGTGKLFDNAKIQEWLKKAEAVLKIFEAIADQASTSKAVAARRLNKRLKKGFEKAFRDAQRHPLSVCYQLYIKSLVKSILQNVSELILGSGSTDRKTDTNLDYLTLSALPLRTRIIHDRALSHAQTTYNI